MKQITEERVMKLEDRVQQLEAELKLIKQQTAQAVEMVSKQIGDELDKVITENRNEMVRVTNSLLNQPKCNT